MCSARLPFASPLQRLLVHHGPRTHGLSGSRFAVRSDGCVHGVPLGSLWVHGFIKHQRYHWNMAYWPSTIGIIYMYHHSSQCCICCINRPKSGDIPFLDIPKKQRGIPVGPATCHPPVRDCRNTAYLWELAESCRLCHENCRRLAKTRKERRSKA